MSQMSNKQVQTSVGIDGDSSQTVDIYAKSNNKDCFGCKKSVVSSIFILLILLAFTFRFTKENELNIKGANASQDISENIFQPSYRRLYSHNLRNANQIQNSQLSLSTLDHPLNSYHNHQPFVLPYQSLGMPQHGLPFNNAPIFPEDYLAFELLQAELFKPHGNTNCQFQSYGGQEGKTVLCKNLISRSQAILNFGAKRGESIGCSLSHGFRLRSLQYGCNCQKPALCGDQLNTYHQLCLSQIVQISKQNVFTSLKKEIDDKGLTAKHIILKLDVGGAEWMALKTLPIQYLNFIDQIVIKFHNPKHPQIAYPLKGYENIIKTLEQKFASVNMHLDNSQCVQDYQNAKHYRKFRSSAIEVTLVNRRLLVIKDSSRLYLTNFKNRISTVYKPDCQMNDSD